MHKIMILPKLKPYPVADSLTYESLLREFSIFVEVTNISAEVEGRSAAEEEVNEDLLLVEVGDIIACSLWDETQLVDGCNLRTAQRGKFHLASTTQLTREALQNRLGIQHAINPGYLSLRRRKEELLPGESDASPKIVLQKGATQDMDDRMRMHTFLGNAATISHQISPHHSQVKEQCTLFSEKSNRKYSYSNNNSVGDPHGAFMNDLCDRESRSHVQQLLGSVLPRGS